MDTLISIINALIFLIDVGGIARIIICFIHIMSAPEGEVGIYKKRIKHLCIFLIIANTILGTTNIILRYYNKSLYNFI